MLTKFAVVTLLIAFSQTIDGKGTVTGKTSKPNKFFKCPTGKSAVGSLLSGIASSLRSKKDLPDICYNVVVNEFTARIGKQGTDDDVRVRLCSDVDGECCDTPVLSSTASDDWSKDSSETWKASRYFGPCKNFKLKVKRGLSVSLVKSNPDNPLIVNSIDISASMVNNTKKNVTKNAVTEEVSFACAGNPTAPAFNFAKKGGQSVKTVLCGVGPYYLGRIHSMNVTTGRGKNDGSNNNVNYKICSDVDDLCCQVNPDSVSKNEYSKGATDRKVATDFGDCAKYLFKIRNSPSITVIKDGKDSLKVTKVDFGFKKQNDGSVSKIRCQGFDFQNECKPASVCTQALTCVDKKWLDVQCSIK